ncbi:hypothetical protein cyc_02040 [Cyclospora cayetanensis]|uniref:Uncharacterized protein n=1 Tax=Cyclospora cayetanensis TaxID=88456 RepID=A0A1D3CZA6_9EIME|nr:hypothetical protein cyc_02040 [Cyclospora cayetanensis]
MVRAYSCECALRDGEEQAGYCTGAVFYFDAYESLVVVANEAANVYSAVVGGIIVTQICVSECWLRCMQAPRKCYALSVGAYGYNVDAVRFIGYVSMPSGGIVLYLLCCEYSLLGFHWKSVSLSA